MSAIDIHNLVSRFEEMAEGAQVFGRAGMVVFKDGTSRLLTTTELEKINE